MIASTDLTLVILASLSMYFKIKNRMQKTRAQALEGMESQPCGVNWQENNSK
jgi:hypothetical protein